MKSQFQGHLRRFFFEIVTLVSFFADPDVPIETEEENDRYFATHLSLQDGLGSHWNAIDSLTSRLPEVTSS